MLSIIILCPPQRLYVDPIGCKARGPFTSGNCGEKPVEKGRKTSSSPVLAALPLCYLFVKSQQHPEPSSCTYYQQQQQQQQQQLCHGSKPDLFPGLLEGWELEELWNSYTLPNTKLYEPPLFVWQPSSPIHPDSLLCATPALFHPPSKVTEICLRYYTGVQLSAGNYWHKEGKQGSGSWLCSLRRCPGEPEFKLNTPLVWCHTFYRMFFTCTKSFEKMLKQYISWGLYMLAFCGT